MRRWRRGARHSVSGKLMFLFLLMAVLFVVLVGASLRHVFSRHFEDNILPHLVQYVEYVQQDIGDPPDRQRALELANKLNIEINILDERGLWSSRQRHLELDELEVERRFTLNGVEYAWVEVDDTGYLMTRTGSTTLLFNVPHARQERESLGGFAPLLVLLGILFVLYYATRRLVSPLRTIQSGVERFAEGDLDHRIAVRRRDEFGELAGTFNTMAAEIQQMLDAKRQLLLAISHELRTPLTRAKVTTELIEDDARKLQLHRELDEMEALIEELMETERLSTRHRALNKSSQDLGSLLQTVANTYFRATPLVLTLPEENAQGNVDPARIKLMLKNLIDNALRHNAEDAPPVEVSLSGTSNAWVFQVRDHGHGIAPEHLSHLTEPFYRVDASRQRATGGYGLGLYLCRMIAEAHGGAIEIESELGTGTTVRVTLSRN